MVILLPLSSHPKVAGSLLPQLAPNIYRPSHHATRITKLSATLPPRPARVHCVSIHVLELMAIGLVGPNIVCQDYLRTLDSRCGDPLFKKGRRQWFPKTQSFLVYLKSGHSVESVREFHPNHIYSLLKGRGCHLKGVNSDLKNNYDLVWINTE